MERSEDCFPSLTHSAFYLDCSSKTSLCPKSWKKEPTRAPVGQGAKWRKAAAYELVREDFETLSNVAMPSAACYNRF